MTAAISCRLVAAAAGLVFSCAATTQTTAPGVVPLLPMRSMQSISPHGFGMIGRGPGSAFGSDGLYGMGSHHGGVSFLRGLGLSEAQRDKIFAIEYAQMLGACEQRKVIEHVRRDLHQMVTPDRYDETCARSLTESLGRVVAHEAQPRAQAGTKIVQVLMPEQREQIANCEAQRVAELPPERSENAPVPELAAM